jgi:hypothetical protein
MYLHISAAGPISRSFTLPRLSPAVTPADDDPGAAAAQQNVHKDNNPTYSLDVYFFAWRGPYHARIDASPVVGPALETQTAAASILQATSCAPH